MVSLLRLGWAAPHFAAWDRERSHTRQKLRHLREEKADLHHHFHFNLSVAPRKQIARCTHPDHVRPCVFDPHHPSTRRVTDINRSLTLGMAQALRYPTIMRLDIALSTCRHLSDHW